MAEVVKHEAASAEMHLLPGAIVLLEMRGPLLARSLFGFAAHATAAHGKVARGFILDYRSALLAAGPDDLRNLLDHVAPDSPLRRPGAFVCTNDQDETMYAHAEQMAWAGFPRRVFAGTLPAYRWVLTTGLIGKAMSS